MGYTPRVLVIGGGAVGTGVARDLAIRGLDVTLVERGGLAAGTSGSMHALLHSGARYAVDDPAVAGACRRENAVLRSIAGDAVTETGGLFVCLESDDRAYVDRHRAACEDAGITVEPLPADTATLREHGLAASVVDATAVPDAVVDPFALCVANAISAHDHGAEIMTGATVVDVERDGDAVDLVRVRADGGESVRSPDHVVNATGPWADRVAGLADVSLPIQHSQGAMLVVERSGLESVLNRCRPRSSGDIVVPFGPSAVLGTTDREVAGPDGIDRDPAELDLLRDELGEMVPAVAAARPFRAYWGVRALPAGDADEPTDRARVATVVDHEERDGLWGMTSVFGGKLTTHRATAERVADRVCAAFGIRRSCRTDELSLPPVPPADGTDTGPTAGAGAVVCDCRAVPRAAVRSVLEHEVVGRGDDIRSAARLTGAGMGACQGGRCAHRLAAEVDLGGAYEPVDRALSEFADARWAGRRYTLRDDGFASAMSTYDHHRRTLNRDGSDAIAPAWERFDAGPAEGPHD